MWSKIKSKLSAAKKSMVIWFNGIVVALSAFSASVPDLLPVVREYLPADFIRYIGYYAAIVIIIRFRNVDKTNANSK